MPEPARRPTLPSVVAALRAARRRSPLLSIELYCPASGCAVRTLTLDLKDHDATLVPTLRRRAPACPACGAALIVHHVHTQAEAERHARRDARASVNLQMRERDAGPDAVMILPLDDYDDDRLPPTPPGWFGAEARP